MGSTDYYDMFCVMGSLNSQHIQDNQYQYDPDLTTMSMFCSTRIPDARVKEFK